MGTIESGDAATGKRPAVTAAAPVVSSGQRPLQGPVLPPPLVPPSATVTAEIPAVPAGAGAGAGRRSGYRVRRRPAPYPLRLTVWLLLFVLVLVLAGGAVEHYHPSWLNTLRNTSAPTASASGPTSGARHHEASSTTSTTPAAFRKLSSTTKGATYSVPASSYSIVVTTTNPCWTVVNSPAGSTHAVFDETIAPSASPKAIAESGSTSVIISATAQSISIKVGGKTVGTIASPKLEYTYAFQPPSA